MSVTSPALDAWHRKVVGEAAKRCLPAFLIYEDMPCFCFLGKPPKEREPCPKGHCQNINDMPQAVLDVANAYANFRADRSDIEQLDKERRCYNGPNWIKALMGLSSTPPMALLSVPSVFGMIDKDVAYFLDRYV